jgi:hypothetical protein
MEADEWEARIRKWEDGIDVSKVSREDLHDYCKARMYYYTLKRQSDENLWDLFQEDFRDFDITVFGRMSRTEVYILRAYLRCGGVYVEQNHQRLSVAQSLVNVIEEETKSEWNDADIN